MPGVASPAPTLVTGSGGDTVSVTQVFPQIIADADRIAAWLHCNETLPFTTCPGGWPLTAHISVGVQESAPADTVTFTGCDGIPFATTTSVLAPVPMVEGMSNSVDTVALPVATPIVLWLWVLQ